jgi:hypothetical protein
MSLHAKFLIHWTDGKFLEIRDDDERRRKYVERLKDTCLHGFWMQRKEPQDGVEGEVLHGVAGSRITANIARVCFSEIRLSQVQNLAREYGGLGIGVHRSFIIKREGNPVFYVQSGATGHIVESFAHVLEKTKVLVGNNEAMRDKLLIPLEIICGYLKNMSEKDSPELKYYNEMEWRVVHVKRLEDQGYIVCQDREHHIYRLKVSKRDIRIIVFPNDETRRMALSFLKNHFGSHWPIVTTLQECGEF